MSPCSAYAVALDAENTMTNPMPTSAATTAKSTVSGGAATYERTGARSSRRRVAARGVAVAALRTGRLPQRGNGGDESLAAIFRRPEHVERRTARRQQHDVARNCDLAGCAHGVVE